jgi:hypothetical protein
LALLAEGLLSVRMPFSSLYFFSRGPEAEKLKWRAIAAMLALLLRVPSLPAGAAAHAASNVERGEK